MLRRRLPYLGLALMWILTGAQAHHSYAEYDDSRTTEIEGTLVRADLINPHVRFSVEGVDANGQPITWVIEATSVNWIQRLEVPPELFRIGSRVKFAGWPSKRSAQRLYGLNMLAANNQEILLFRTARPRWNDATI